MSLKFKVISCFCLLAIPFLSANEKPNVLLIMADDLNTALSGYGHPQCKTPQLDRLASQGVQFDNMHCQYPVCGASRASIMTGLYPYKNGYMGNGANLRAKIPDVLTLPQLFRENGYRVARISKIYHMGIPKEIIEGSTRHDDPESWELAINIKAPEQNALGKRTNWSPKDKGSQKFLSVESSAGDLEHADGMAATEAIRLLNEYKEDPFFLAVGFVRPHVPLVAPAKYFDLYDQKEMKIPEVPENDLDDIPKVIRAYKSNDTTYGVTDELHKGLLEAYYASVSYMDAQVGRVLDELKRLNLDKNTIVIFTSDHGYLLGHHHKYQKQHLFEEATRVPFILKAPFLEYPQGTKTKQLTELIDLYPTIADLAGLHAPENLQGKSLVPLLLDSEYNQWDRDFAFTVSRSGGESIRSRKYRYTHWRYGAGGDELYDLEKDPGEFTNLAKNPEYAAVLEKLKLQLAKKRKVAGYQEYLEFRKNKK